MGSFNKPVDLLQELCHNAFYRITAQGYDKMSEPSHKNEDTNLHDNNYRSIYFAISPQDSSCAFSLSFNFPYF